jgi:hypothetical protein
MSLVLCLALLALSIPDCSAYNVNLVLPTSTSDTHTYTQWISMAKLAADEVNDRWQPMNSLDLGLFPFPEQDSLQAAGYAIQSGQNASTLALIAAGDINTVDNMASIAKWFSVRPLEMPETWSRVCPLRSLRTSSAASVSCFSYYHLLR